MKPMSFRGGGAAIVIGAFVLLGVAFTSQHVRAGNDDDRDRDRDEDSKVERGLKIAPVKLTFSKKNKELVGLGSYIVNAVGDCNGCHSAGPPTEFTATGNPYTLLSPAGPFDGHKKINKDTYLGGGRDFGLFPPGSVSPLAVHIISRNLTPDKTGRPIGGDTFQEFRHTMRTGVDPDSLHPSLPFPFNGALLQIMRWPFFQDMTDHDLRAIYEYLSAIPCIPGPAAPNPLHHDCF